MLYSQQMNDLDAGYRPKSVDMHSVTLFDIQIIQMQTESHYYIWLAEFGLSSHFGLLKNENSKFRTSRRNTTIIRDLDYNLLN